MIKICKSADELIGETPLLQLSRICEKENLQANIYAKIEYFNLSGSVKDRIAKSMIEDAEKRGVLKKGMAIIEPTSGNTGIGLAAVGAAKGYKVIIVMPETMSVERRQLIKAYGAQIVLSDGSLGMKGAVLKAEEIAATQGGVVLGQFENSANAMAHYTTTGPEIYNALGGKIDYFIAGVGTGGTISGVGRFLKEKNPDIKIIAVEPKSSPLLSQGVAAAHKIQGIGANFVPQVLDLSVIDQIITVGDDDAFLYERMLAHTEGLLTGISSGAALKAAAQVASKSENKGKNIVVLLPDSGDRYLSTAAFE